MATPPQLTPEQRAAALEKAAEARTARAEIKARLKMGSMTLAEALDSDDPNVLKLKVVSLLESLPGVGPATATAIVTERERNGPFLDVDDLDRVPGIGPAKLEALRGLVTT